LPYQAWHARARIVEVNPAPSELTDLAHIYLQGPAGDILPRLLQQMDR
jgi:NAD-dependent deacetylase